MLRNLILTATLVAPCIFVIPALAQDNLPEADGKAVTVRICTGCYGAEMWSGSRRSGDDWDRTITTMTEKGLAINDADYAAVLDYLSKNLGPIVPKVNINKATSADLQKLLAISAAQADAIVAYRVKNGDFKDLDSVKKVPGVDAGVIDAKKNRIVFS